MARRKSVIPGFSMKRALGVTSSKRKFAKFTGIPTTKSGRRNKARRIITGGGCLVPVVLAAGLLSIIIILL